MKERRRRWRSCRLDPLRAEVVFLREHGRLSLGRIVVWLRDHAGVEITREGLRLSLLRWRREAEAMGVPFSRLPLLSEEVKQELHMQARACRALDGRVGGRRRRPVVLDGSARELVRRLWGSGAPVMEIVWRLRRRGLSVSLRTVYRLVVEMRKEGRDGV